jgi:hypothetical protein
MLNRGLTAYGESRAGKPPSRLFSLVKLGFAVRPDEAQKVTVDPCRPFVRSDVRRAVASDIEGER